MYIDPNSGGMLFQIAVVAIGLVSGVILVFSSRIKMGVARLKRAFREKFAQDHPSDPGRG
jgi:hypothetical protein